MPVTPEIVSEQQGRTFALDLAKSIIQVAEQICKETNSNISEVAEAVYKEVGFQLHDIQNDV